MTTVYVIAAEDGPVRIGAAIDPLARLRQLRSTAPYKLRLAHFETVGYENAFRVRNTAHALLGQAKLGGGWFKATPEEAIRDVRTAVAQVCGSSVVTLQGVASSRPGNTDALTDAAADPAPEAFFRIDPDRWLRVCACGPQVAAAFLALGHCTADPDRPAASASAVARCLGLPHTATRRLLQILCGMGAAYQARSGRRPLYRMTGRDDVSWTAIPHAVADPDADGRSPIAAIVASGDPGALRLLVDLYRLQNLPDHHGIDWRLIHLAYTRTDIAQWHGHGVFGFLPHQLVMGAAGRPADSASSPWTVGQEIADPNVGLDAFWEAFKTIERLRLVTFVPHLIIGTQLGIACPEETGTTDERVVGRAMHQAGEAILARLGVEIPGDLTLVPLDARLTDVRMIGVVRLVHLADTPSTRRWMEDVRLWRERAALFESIRDTVRVGVG